MELSRSHESADARFGTAGSLLVALYRGTTSLAVLA